MNPKARPWLTLGCVAAAFAVLPFVMPGGSFDLYPFAGDRFPVHAGFIDLATTTLIFALFALGFNILFGHTGELSFGHAMFFSIGAYATALTTKGFDVSPFGLHLAFAGMSNAWLALAVSLGVVALWAWFVARLIVPRSSGIYYSMITLAFAQVIYSITFHWGDLTGGEDGIQSIERPHLPGLPNNWLQDSTHVYIFTAVIAFIAVAVAYWILHSRFGSVLHAIRENKGRAAFLGYDVDKYRVNAFVISAIFPGIAGWLWTYFQQSINPDAGSIDYSGRVVMMSLLGGIGTFVGPMLGAFVYWDLQNRVSGLTKYWPATIGVVFAFFVLVGPSGIAGDVRQSATTPRWVAAVTEPSGYAFKTEHLSRSFAGFKAVNDVSIEIPSGGVRTIIGPNGAGKTTFFNLLSGHFPPSSGAIFFDGRDITKLPPYRRARLGIARSFQITNIFGKLSVGENVRLAVQAAYDGRASFFFDNAAMNGIAGRTHAVLGDIGLLDVAENLAENLSHGDQRRLEIGLVLARDPKVLLLDEPLAGMSPAETQATVELIVRIAPGRTILLVEHDIEVVMAISTTITVLQTGQVLASGTPQEIRANAAVQRAYLGEIA